MRDRVPRRAPAPRDERQSCELHRVTIVDITGTRIRVDHLKVAAAEYLLDRAVLVRGPSGRGKSTIPDAIIFAGLGYVPSVGRANPATAKLVRGGASFASVTLELDGATAEESRAFRERFLLGYQRAGG